MQKLTVKERVVEAALDLFQEKGYHGVSVEELVERATTSKGGFYHHFKSKDDLLYEIHDIFISYVLKETKNACEQHHSAIDQLDTLMRTFMNVFNIYQRHITVFYNESVYLLPEHEALINKKRTAYRKLLEQILTNGQQQHVFRQELSITITAMLIIGTVNWTYKWYKQHGPLTMHDITRYFNDVILRGILTEEGYLEASAKHYLL